MTLKYFSIDAIKRSIDRLKNYDSKWIIVPLVFAINGVDDLKDTDVQASGKPGTNKFLDKYFSGRSIGLRGGGSNTLRPKFREMSPALNSDYLQNGSSNLWGSTYSSRGYREMTSSRIVSSSATSHFKLESGFKNKFETELDTNFYFEDVLTWLFAFDGIPDSVANWNGLFRYFLDRELGVGINLPSIYSSRFGITGTLPWPTDFLPVRPDNEEFIRELIPSKHSPYKTTLPTTATSDQCSFNLSISLASKGFVILSGPSGTGKTRNGIQLAKSLGAQLGLNDIHVSVPVGAGWTDTRNLLGYKNPFGTPRNVAGSTINETYEIPDTLRLLLRSVHTDRITIPHFLLLDEMNLSHVERYFSPFLSLMEISRISSSEDALLISKSSISLISDILAQENPSSIEAESALNLKLLGAGLSLPQNFFIIGSINVDETTYMFSPKVLDRAHVVEMLTVLPSEYMAGKISVERTLSAKSALEVLQSANYAPLLGLPGQNFKDTAISLLFDSTWADEAVNQIENLLEGAYILLEPVGFAFGYRLINEVFRYLEVWLLAQSKRCVEEGLTSPDVDGWLDALDRVFLQKVLPKIHGNRRQLGESLSALANFLNGNDESTSLPAKYRLDSTEDVKIPVGKGLRLTGTGTTVDQMPASRKKLARMSRRLIATNYTTFVE